MTKKGIQIKCDRTLRLKRSHTHTHQLNEFIKFRSSVIAINAAWIPAVVTLRQQ